VRKKSDPTFAPHSCHSPLSWHTASEARCVRTQGSRKSSHRSRFIVGEEEETGTDGEVMECVWGRGLLGLPPYPKLSWISSGSRYEVVASWVQFWVGTGPLIVDPTSRLKKWTQHGAHLLEGPYRVGPAVMWVPLYVGPMFCGTRFDWVVLWLGPT
jgi:hypothetical protein